MWRGRIAGPAPMRRLMADPCSVVDEFRMKDAPREIHDDRPPWTASTVYSALVTDPDRASAPVAAEPTLDRAAHAGLMQGPLHAPSRRLALGLRVTDGPSAS